MLKKVAGTVVIAAVWVSVLALLLYVRTYSGQDLVTFNWLIGWRVENVAGESVTANADSTGYFEAVEIREECGGKPVQCDDDPFYGKRQNDGCFVADTQEWESGSVHLMTEGSAETTIASEGEIVTVKMWADPETVGVPISIVVTVIALVVWACFFLLTEEDHRR